MIDNPLHQAFDIIDSWNKFPRNETQNHNRMNSLVQAAILEKICKGIPVFQENDKIVTKLTYLQESTILLLIQLAYM